MKKLLFLLTIFSFGACQNDDSFTNVTQPCNHISELPSLKKLGFGLSVVDLGTEYNGTFKEVQFVSNAVGFMYATNNVGGYIDIFKTTDGGMTWQNLNVDIKTQPYGVRFKNEQEGFLTGYFPENAGIYKTIDGGVTWEKKEFPDYKGYFSKFNIDKNGDLYTFFATLEGVRTLLKSTDNGDTWTEIYTNNDVRWTLSYHFPIIDDYMLIFSESGQILKLDLDGNVLKTIETNHEGISAIEIFDENTMIVSGLYSMLKTVDGGDTWSNFSESSFDHVMVGFSSENEGVIIRSKEICPTDYILSSDVFAYTTDGGQSWEESEISVNLTQNFGGSHVLPNGDYLMLGFKELLRIRKL